MVSMWTNWNCHIVWDILNRMITLEKACQFLVKLNIYQPWDFLSSPVVRTPPFHYRGTQVESLIEELRFHMLCGMARKKKKEKKKSPCNSGYSTKYLTKEIKTQVHKKPCTRYS